MDGTDHIAISELSMSDQPGKDLPVVSQAVQETYTTLESLYANTTLPGRIFIRSWNRKRRSAIEDVVVPLPQSHEAAIMIAFHQLGKHIYADPGAFLQDAYFEYRMRNYYDQSEYHWAKLPSECWTRIVQDGDHLQLRFRKVPNKNLPTPRSTVKFIELLDFPNSQGRVVSFPRPGSYAVAKLVANGLFYKRKHMSDIILFMKEKEESLEPWRVVNSDITEEDWMAVMNRNTEEVEKLEIGVWGY